MTEGKRTRTRAGTPAVRYVVLVVALLAATFHAFATVVWVAPDSGMRQVFPGDSLRGYMLPLFGQSWSVFAPDPVNGDYIVEIRAVTEVDGERTRTEWVSATDAELHLVRQQLFPARAGIVSWTAGSEYKRAYDRLEPRQQQIVALSYHKGGDWLERLERAVRKAGDTSAANRFLTQERRLSAYATQAAYALWGENVAAVQYRVSRQAVVPFAERHDPDATRPTPRTIESGWRGLLEVEGQSRNAFGDTFRSLVDTSGQDY